MIGGWSPNVRWRTSWMAHPHIGQNAHQATVLSLRVAIKMFIGLVLLGFKEKITGSPSSNGKMSIFPFTNPLKLQTLSCKLHFEGWGYKSLWKWCVDSSKIVKRACTPVTSSDTPKNHQDEIHIFMYYIFMCVCVCVQYVDYEWMTNFPNSGCLIWTVHTHWISSTILSGSWSILANYPAKTHTLFLAG